VSVEHHRVVIVGGGAAGITMAARLGRAEVHDVALIEPSARHYYQPLWTLVGGGEVPATASVRPEAKVVPRRTRWVRDRAVEIDPDGRQVSTAGGLRVGYDALVVAAGIQLDWDVIPGLTEGIERGEVTSNYRFDLAPRNWERVHSFGGGTAVFAGVAGPHKCGGAIQKATYLAADEFRRRGVLDASDVVLATPAESIFGVPEFAEPLAKVVERYSIDTRFGHELVEVRPSEREAVFKTRDGPTTTLTYDLLHAVPPQSAPDFLKSGPLAVPDDPRGWVDVDGETLQHRRHPDVFALGDCSGAPNAKTGAAARKQAPIVVDNLLAVLAGSEPAARYDGYSSCPIVTGYGKVVLAEFDYTGRPHKTIPLIDTARERRSMWLLKRYGLPFLYWHLMLRGRA
jgi:sulfide:quinone oxidoreductase